LVLAAIFFLGGLYLYKSSQGDAGQQEDSTVTLRAAEIAGANSFTPSVAQAPETSGIPSASPPQSSGGLTMARGSSASLYAATRNIASCNAGQLTSYLQTNADRAGPWASAFGLQPTDIQPLVAGLTPVLTRADTRVTEYVFSGGKAVGDQVVLQRGTAVFIDRTGIPRIRCASGNPLRPPQPISGTARYKGAPWPGFSPGSLVTVSPSASPASVLTLADTRDGTIFGRIPGSTVILDIDLPAPGVVVPVVEPGQTSTVRGNGWPTGAVLRIGFDDPAAELATATADVLSNFSAEVTIPLGAAPRAHQVTITDGTTTVTQTFYVIPPTVQLT
jgi:hypothetical protein